MRTLVLGSRASRLALWQAGWVRERIEARGCPVRIEVIHTSGDRLADRPLTAIGGQGVFVKEIEEALLTGTIDLAVHSLKDLPTKQPEGLLLACVPEREDPRDLLASPGGPPLLALRPGAVVGTGSPRRACQIRALRVDLEIQDLRGNVDTRVLKLQRGEYDAIVLACAGVKRLGLSVEGSVLEFDQMLPAVGQGALAIETRADDRDAADAIGPLHHPATAATVAAERAFLRGLGGGCQAPIAAVAEAGGNRILLRGLVGGPAGERLLRGQREGPLSQPDATGLALADDLLAQGAAALLEGEGSRPAEPR